MRLTPRRQMFVLSFDNLASQITIGFVPPAALMAEHLNVDSELIENLQPPRSQDQRAIQISRDVSREIGVLDDVEFFRRNKVAVNIDDLHALFSNKHLALQKRGAGYALQELSSV